MKGRFVGSLVFLSVGFLLVSLHADAQQANGLSDQLQRMRGQVEGSNPQEQGASQQTVILEPNAAPNPSLPTSRLEQILSARAGAKLRQFGYDQLGVGRAITIPRMGSVQEGYVLGPGDEIVVALRGQENAEYRATVDRDGRVLLPRLSPISASGRTLGEFKQELLAAIKRSFISTEGYVSVGRVRQVSVLVSGEVNSPGVRILSGLSSAVDAVLVSGGIRKSGSLRNVRILRGGRTISVDLYSVLTGQAHASSAMLADGDRIIVPPLGPTVAVVGWVRRPGIYEMTSARAALSLGELLSLAGGLEVRGKYRISILDVGPDGRNQMRTLEGERATVRDSDIVFVQPAASQTVGRVTLSGGTALAGQYSTRNTKLSEMLKAPGALGENPYTLFGIISRRDPVSLMRTLIPFAPVAVLKGEDDMDVQSDDIVRVLSAKEAQLLFLTLRQYEDRRAKVEGALLGPESSMQVAQEGPVNTAATPTGQTMLQQQQPSVPVAMADSRQDTAAETEAESLKRVEHDIEIAARKANGTAFSGAYAPPNSGMNPGAGQFQQQGMSDVQGTYGRSDSTGGLPSDMQQGGQYQEQMANSAGQQVGPYRDPRTGLDSPTLGQNLQEQSLSAGQVPTNQDVSKASQLASQLEVDPVVFINFLSDHKVMVGGAVHGPGLYLVGPDADIQSVLQAAGGLLRWADRKSIEVVSTTVDTNSATSKTQRNTVSLTDAGSTGYIVKPRDEVRVNQITTDAGVGQVVLQGQVRNTGTYQIGRGERLSDLLARAGGLTGTAYPYGTVFLRRSVAAQEEIAYRREAREIEEQLLIAMSRRDSGASGSNAFMSMQGYVNQLKNQKALGRMTIMADPAVLAANPAKDPLLEPGDLIFVPQRPYSVSVLGEVLQPGSIPYSPEMSAMDYVERAGGYSQFADSSQVVLVLPDGSARRVERSFFSLSFANGDIPPGSTIYVARDVSAIDLHQIIVDSAAIITQLATSAALVAVLSRRSTN